MALFFETEIWPSYIHFLKKRGVKLVLINARMSRSTYKTFKRFRFLFGTAIRQFDLVMAKSVTDSKKFKQFNPNTIVCGNIKQFKERRTAKSNTKSQFLIDSDKPILVLASFHIEEFDLAVRITSALSDVFFIVIAPRHLEDVQDLERELKKRGIDFTKRTAKQKPKDVLILDSMGELEDVYSISKACIIGGSFNEKLKGHNPIEPLVYNNFTICGPYMESFEEELNQLKALKLIEQVSSLDEILRALRKPRDVDASPYFKNLEYILNCYIINTKNILTKN